jgi:stage II sporulation protein M
MSKKRVEKKKGSSIDKYFNDSLKLSLKTICKQKNYIFFSIIIFLLFGLTGYIFPHIFEDKITQMLREIVEKTKDLNTFELISYITVNNIKASLYGLFFGMLFSLIPLTMLVVNGYLLGFVSRKVVDETSILVLWRLFPHGIFELPAVIISISLGIRLGLFLFLSKDISSKEFLNWLKESVRVFFFVIIPLLVIAGITEGVLISALG